MTADNRALVALVAERVMGLTPCDLRPARGRSCIQSRHFHRATPGAVTFDPLADDRDFGALLDKCAERWPVGLRHEAACEWVASVGPWFSYGARRRALVLAAAEAVWAEGETP